MKQELKSLKISDLFSLKVDYGAARGSARVMLKKCSKDIQQ